MEGLPNYDIIKGKADTFYREINHVRCHALNNDAINFSAEGFRHLMYKGQKRIQERNRGVQIMKFKLLPRAKIILEISTTFQEYQENLVEIKKKKHKRIVFENAIVKYWGFVAIIRDRRVKVIVKQIGNGQKQFWSVIPAWSKSYYKDIKIISMSKGDMIED